MLMEDSEEGAEEQRAEIVSTDGRIMALALETGNGWVEYDEADTENRIAMGILGTVKRLSAAPDVIPAVLLTTQFSPNLDGAKLVGNTVIDGLSVYHLKGSGSFITEPPDDWPAEIKEGYPRNQDDSKYDLYVSIENLLPRRMVSTLDITSVDLKSEVSDLEPMFTVTTSDYLDFNAPVAISLPEVP
ncbi:MAG: hypothetical protein O2913_11460 [Chloroflexi bacterium]|nr:hypothetical protein [Chloroflexota bacterium]